MADYPKPASLVCGLLVRTLSALLLVLALAGPVVGQTVDPNSAALFHIIGPQAVLILRVHGTIPDYSLATAENLVAQANDKIKWSSYSRAWLATTISPWLTIDPVSGCDYLSAGDRADVKARDLGYNLEAPGLRIVYAISLSNCNWAGQARPGSNRAWVNGGLYPGVLAHELGHLFGLPHTVGVYCLGCTSYDGNGVYDFMGRYTQGSESLPGKVRLGWLDDGDGPRTVTASNSGAYTIGDANVIDGAPKGLRIVRRYTNGVPEVVYLERRQAIGQDAFMASAPYTPGVTGFLLTFGSTAAVQLVDATPNTPSFGDAPLQPGSTFTDAGRFSVQAVGSHDLLVTILAPSLTCSPAAVSIAPGDSVTLTASGGDGSYGWWQGIGRLGWRIAGSTLTVTLTEVGTYVYEVGSGPQLATCTVTVGEGGTPPPPPPPLPEATIAAKIGTVLVQWGQVTPWSLGFGTDLRRDDVVIATLPAGVFQYRDDLTDVPAGAHVYQACVAGSTNCSVSVWVSDGGQ